MTPNIPLFVPVAEHRRVQSERDELRERLKRVEAWAAAVCAHPSPEMLEKLRAVLREKH